MSDAIKIVDLPDGRAIVEHEGEIIHLSVEEIAEMERDYKEALLRIKGGSP